MFIKKYNLLIIALMLSLHNGLLISADPSRNGSLSLGIKKKVYSALAATGSCMAGSCAQNQEYPIWQSVMEVDLEGLESHLNRSGIKRRIFGEVDVNERNPQDQFYPLSTPMHIATEADHAFTHPQRYIDNLRICNELLQKGADIHTLVDDKGRTVFDKIVQNARSVLQEEREFGKQLFFICQRNGLMTLTMNAAAEQNCIVLSDRAVGAYLCRSNNNMAKLLSGTPHGKPANRLGNDLATEIAKFLTESS